MGGYPGRHVDDQEAISILQALTDNQGEWRRRPVKDAPSNQVGRVVRRGADESFGSGFRFVVNPKDNATAVRVGETDSGVGQNSEGVLRALCWLLELKLLALEVSSRDAVAKLSENLIDVR